MLERVSVSFRSVLISFSRRGLLLGGALGFLVSGFAQPNGQETGPSPRIVSLAPSLTDLLFLLDAGSHLVGRTRWCDYPSGVETIPSVGNLHDPDLETLLLLKPDRIVLTDMTPLSLRRRLERLGLSTVYLPQNSLADIFEAVRVLGGLIDVQTAERAEQWIEHLESQFAARRKQFNFADQAGPPKAWFVYDLQSLSTAGIGSFPSDLMEQLGLQNIAEGTGSAWPRLSREGLLGRPPDIIFLTRKGGVGDAPKEIVEKAEDWIQQVREDRFWGSLPAVREGRVYRLPTDPFTIPGSRIDRAFEALALALEDAFSKP